VGVSFLSCDRVSFSTKYQLTLRLLRHRLWRRRWAQQVVPRRKSGICCLLAQKPGLTSTKNKRYDREDVVFVRVSIEKELLTMRNVLLVVLLDVKCWAQFRASRLPFACWLASGTELGPWGHSDEPLL
jgi:hypothetical protein